MLKKNKIPGIMLAAVKSGSGKTTLTCALLELLKEKGLNPQAFKCGPDYIDPMFHREVIGVPSHNLDSFFASKEQLREIYLDSMDGKGMAVVEGAMGLFDGLGGISEEGSAYHVAAILRLPIVLIVDAHGMGRSILPLLAGFLQYDKEKRIAGVILNKTSEHFYQAIAPVIEEELKLPVLGYLPKKKELALESRHLGLKMPEEIGHLKKQICQAAKLVEESVSIEKLVELSGRAGNLPIAEKAVLSKGFETEVNAVVKIGIARDEAFCFYYEDNLKLLEKMGAELVPFSPLYDTKLPEGLDGILLGGGYPELYAKQLEQNGSMREAVRNAIAAGTPSLAECGGFMYLHHALEDEKGNTYTMCKVVPGKCFYTGKPVRFGYIELEEKKPAFLSKETIIKGHEFHYYDSENNGGNCIARKPVTNRSWECVHSGKENFWGFPHLYYPSNPDFARHFIEAVKLFQEQKRKEAGS
ncbi:MAG: cobyrinate a,c-diamide synthase [Lachnospiraceae bacterium]|nr:cobyrinate a,c-diamide synthase [Lachnospiraceae bacterium]